MLETYCVKLSKINVNASTDWVAVAEHPRLQPDVQVKDCG